LSWYSPQPRQLPKRLPRRRPIKAIPSGIGDKGIVGNWLFYYLKGGDHLHDFSPYKNHGTINGAKWVDGRYGWALDFSGGDYYVEAPDAPSLDFSGSFSMVYWAKFNNVSTEQWLVSKGGGYSRKGFFSTIGTSTGVLRFGMGNGTDEVRADNSGFTTGTWYFIVMTYDGNTMRVYKNGDLLPNTNTNTYDYVNDYPVRMGLCDKGNALPLNGRLTYVSIYNERKSVSWIKRRFERTRGIFGL